MEALFVVGELGISRRDGNRRFYDLIERLVPAKLLEHARQRGRAAASSAPQPAPGSGADGRRRRGRAGARHRQGRRTARDDRGRSSTTARSSRSRSRASARRATSWPTSCRSSKRPPTPGCRSAIGLIPGAPRSADVGPPPGQGPVRLRLHLGGLHPRARSAGTATTCCRSCSATAWWAASSRASSAATRTLRIARHLVRGWLQPDGGACIRPCPWQCARRLPRVRRGRIRDLAADATGPRHRRRAAAHRSVSVELLSRAALSRATLARQLLLERVPMTPYDAVQHLLGLQAQTPQSWYLTLWSRLADFDPIATGRLIEERRLVRLPVDALDAPPRDRDDALVLRAFTQPTIDRGIRGHLGGAARRDRPGRAGGRGRAASPLTPRVRPRTCSRTSTPGGPGGSGWRSPTPCARWCRWSRFRLAGCGVAAARPGWRPLDAWLGRAVPALVDPEPILLRYLAAFGPGIGDGCAGLVGRDATAARCSSGCDRASETFRDESGHELFDLPDAPRPDPETPAPVRFLADFDNLLLSHADRSRFVDEVDQAAVRLRRRPVSRHADGGWHRGWPVVSSGATSVRRRWSSGWSGPLTAERGSCRPERSRRRASLLVPRCRRVFRRADWLRRTRGGPSCGFSEGDVPGDPLAASKTRRPPAEDFHVPRMTCLVGPVVYSSVSVPLFASSPSAGELPFSELSNTTTRSVATSDACPSADR